MIEKMTTRKIVTASILELGPLTKIPISIISYAGGICTRRPTLNNINKSPERTSRYLQFNVKALPWSEEHYD